MNRPHVKPLGIKLKQEYRLYNSFSPKAITGTSEALMINKEFDL
jgi:hypothetical protein